MAKRSLTVKNRQKGARASEDGRADLLAQDQHMEISELYNPFPDADEIAKFAVYMPDAPQRLFTYVEEEQKFRHSSYQEKMVIVRKDHVTDNTVRILCSIFSFFLFLSAMGISGYLIHEGNVVTGSIFTGLTLVSGIGMFLRVANKEKTKEN